MEKREKFSKITLIFFILFLIWAILQFAAPLALPSNSVNELSGLVGVSDNDKKFENLSPPWKSLYSIGDKLCHQIEERSFIINSNQMPFCSRCTAIWIGIAIGLGFLTFYHIELDEKFIYLILLGLIPIGIDGTLQLIKVWESTNIIRVITGLLAGCITGFAIGIIIHEINEIIKKEKKKS